MNPGRRDPSSVFVEGPALLVGKSEALILWPAVKDLALQLQTQGATRKLHALGPLLDRWQTLVAMAEADVAVRTYGYRGAGARVGRVADVDGVRPEADVEPAVRFVREPAFGSVTCERFVREPVGGLAATAGARSSRNGSGVAAAEAAERLGCSAQHIRRLARKGELDVGDVKAIKRGHAWTIPVAGVEAYLQRKEAAA